MMNDATDTSKASYIMGVMSGTSCDGINIALIHADHHQLIHIEEYPIPNDMRESILRLCSPSMDEINHMGSLSRSLGHMYASAVLSTIKTHNIDAKQILAIGNHGQTIRHQPKVKAGALPFSLQIGCAATLAEGTGITVVSNFRNRDIAAGGQGAPLVPFAHKQLFANADSSTAILNIGGISNITMLNEGGDIQGFDTGPGNMLMDALMLTLTDARHAYDKDGALAASGEVCPELLHTLMQHPFITKKPPKSTGREDFGEDILHQILAWEDLSDADRMATTLAFTTQSIAAQIQYLHNTPKRWLICGGGACNNTLMQSLQKRLAPAEVSTTDSYGIPSSAVEAISFALLARQTLLGQTNTLAEVTGAKHAVCGGQITPGENWQDVLQWIAMQYD